MRCIKAIELDEYKDCNIYEHYVEFTWDNDVVSFTKEEMITLLPSLQQWVNIPTQNDACAQ
jgi:hypothetical protein